MLLHSKARYVRKLSMTHFRSFEHHQEGGRAQTFVTFVGKSFPSWRHNISQPTVLRQGYVMHRSPYTSSAPHNSSRAHLSAGFGLDGVGTFLAAEVGALIVSIRGLGDSAFDSIQAERGAFKSWIRCERSVRTVDQTVLKTPDIRSRQPLFIYDLIQIVIFPKSLTCSQSFNQSPLSSGLDPERKLRAHFLQQRFHLSISIGNHIRIHVQ